MGLAIDKKKVQLQNIEVYSKSDRSTGYFRNLAEVAIRWLALIQLYLIFSTVAKMLIKAMKLQVPLLGPVV
jgi:hypothetical protein